MLGSIWKIFRVVTEWGDQAMDDGVVTPVEIADLGMKVCKILKVKTSIPSSKIIEVLAKLEDDIGMAADNDG